jgi:hypothetical protein
VSLLFSWCCCWQAVRRAEIQTWRFLLHAQFLQMHIDHFENTKKKELLAQRKTSHISRSDAKLPPPRMRRHFSVYRVRDRFLRVHWLFVLPMLLDRPFRKPWWLWRMDRNILGRWGRSCRWWRRRGLPKGMTYTPLMETIYHTWEWIAEMLRLGTFRMLIYSRFVALDRAYMICISAHWF